MNTLVNWLLIWLTRPSAFGLAWLVLNFLGATLPACGATVTTSPPFFDKSIRPVVREYCLDCHSAKEQKGDLDLERFSSIDEVKKHPKVWQRVIEQLTTNEMPPKKKPQPTSTERERLLAWVNAVLDEVALARAGDPGPVVLRRLSNAEYTYTIRDLTGVESLDPAREFPTDSASGEGFMNVGNSLVMSPSLLTKYLDAAKEIASHAMLLPDGMRFSSKNTRRDWTEEILAEIRGFYAEFTEPGGGTSVDLQGIKFATEDGGVLPLERYLAVLLKERSGQAPDSKRRGISPKYLKRLHGILEGSEPSILLDSIRARWRVANAREAGTIAAEIAQWQQALWKFNSVGHIGKAGGPKAWMEPVNPIATKQEVRVKIPAATDGKDATLYLVVGDAGDGNEHDFVVWQLPRLVAPGRPELLLRDVRDVASQLAARRARIFAATTRSLEAAADAGAAPSQNEIAELARIHDVEVDVLRGWLDYLGVGAGGPAKIDSYFTNTIKSASNYDFIKGWNNSDLPSVVANSSDQHVRIPGNMKPHSVAVHPTPKLQAGLGWRSPVTATLRVEATVQHAHPECGNGVTWSLELRRGAIRQRLAAGTAQGDKEVKAGPIERLGVRQGDLVSMLIGPRDGNHSCDLTAVDLTIATAGEGGREWNLAKDVSPDVLAGNPHADRFGNAAVWHFYSEPDKGSNEGGLVIPAGSLLARWQSASSAEEKQKLAEQLQKLLTSDPPTAKNSPDAKLYLQLTSFGGPLLRTMGARADTLASDDVSEVARTPTALEWGLDSALFGKRLDGTAIEPGSLCARAPSVIEVRLPADLVAECDFVARGVLDNKSGREGSVQFQVLTNKPAGEWRLVASAAKVQGGKGTWTDGDKPMVHAAPIVVGEGSAAHRRIESAFDEFRQVFPAALCYTKIVPVDEVVTLTLYYREDHHLKRLLLDDAQVARLDRLWDELRYVSQDALTLVDAYEQLWQYATQDADPKVFEPMRQPIMDRAAAFRQLLHDTEPKQVDAALKLADKAYRRPLTDTEKDELRRLYKKLRDEELPHEEAIRLVLARVLVSPAFLYRAEKPGPGSQPGPVTDWELASRLSYFLWSSAPDAELRNIAAKGALRDPAVLVAQTRRMLRDTRVRRLAVEFGCAWLHIYDFENLSEKSERHFPTFTELRGAMYEESIRFFTDLFQNNRPVLSILNADYTFLNEALAKHYGVPGVTGPEWRRVDNITKFSRGGILGQATTLAKHSGASRTSPILRGNWISEVLLGEKLPRPPKDVPQLPEDEATETLTVRQLTEKHTTDPLCANCHARIDPFGFALETFDAIGRRRERDLGDRPIDTRAKVPDGSELEGIEGLRHYLLTKRRDDFVKQFCRKLLGYALGREVLISDRPLLDEMRQQLKANDHRVSAAIETIIRSRQFREIRGKEMASDD